MLEFSDVTMLQSELGIKNIFLSFRLFVRRFIGSGSRKKSRLRSTIYVSRSMFYNVYLEWMFETIHILFPVYIRDPALSRIWRKDGFVSRNRILKVLDKLFLEFCSYISRIWYMYKMYIHFISSNQTRPYISLFYLFINVYNT